METGGELKGIDEDTIKKLGYYLNAQPDYLKGKTQHPHEKIHSQNSEKAAIVPITILDDVGVAEFVEISNWNKELLLLLLIYSFYHRSKDAKFAAELREVITFAEELSKTTNERRRKSCQGQNLFVLNQLNEIAQKENIYYWRLRYLRLLYGESVEETCRRFEMKKQSYNNLELYGENIKTKIKRLGREEAIQSICEQAGCTVEFLTKNTLLSLSEIDPYVIRKSGRGTYTWNGSCYQYQSIYPTKGEGELMELKCSLGEDALEKILTIVRDPSRDTAVLYMMMEKIRGKLLEELYATYDKLAEKKYL